MSKLRRLALKTPVLKEIAVRRLGASDLALAIREGQLSSDVMHRLAAHAVAQPNMPVLSSGVPLSPYDFAVNAIASGRLSAKDHAALVVVGLYHWDLRLPAAEYAKVVETNPDHIHAIVASGHEHAVRALQQACELGLVSDETKLAIEDAVRSWDVEGLIEKRRTGLAQRAAQMLDEEGPVVDSPAESQARGRTIR